MPKVISDDQILDAALNVMVEQGYTGATTRQIAAAANINEVTLFRRFGNKKKLITAALEQEAENFAAAGIEYTGALEADLLRIAQFYRNLVQKRGHVIPVLLAEVPRQPELMEVMQTPLRLLGRIMALIERYQQQGELVEEPPFHAAASLIGPLLITGLGESIRPELVDAPFDAEEHVRRFLCGRGLNETADDRASVAPQ